MLVEPVLEPLCVVLDGELEVLDEEVLCADALIENATTTAATNNFIFMLCSSETAFPLRLMEDGSARDEVVPGPGGRRESMP